jgi:CarboxypepD_reg-like domain
MPTRFLLRSLLCGSLLLLMMAGTVCAQAPRPAPIRVRGLVLGAVDRRPIPGAGVFVTETRQGTVADVLGAFQITIQRTDTLVIRAIGFESRRFTVKPNTPEQIAIEILLYPDSVQLSQVTIIGDRPDRPEINRALRAIRRPSTAPEMARRSVGKPIFEPKPTEAPEAPHALLNPVSFLYEQFSRSGRNRRKLAEWEAQRAAELEYERQQKLEGRQGE